MLLPLLLVIGCGGGSESPRRADAFPYDRSRPLRPRILDVDKRRKVTVQRLTFAASDGRRVPALLALPRTVRRPRGCLIYQGGLGSEKEDAAFIWQGAADIGLATFTIEPRRREVHSARGIASVLRENVRELRRGLDYLGTRRECRHNVGYLGISLGGALGALLAGADDRISAAVLASIGATWRAALLSSDSLLPGTAEDEERLDAAAARLRPLDPARWVGKIAPRPVMLVNGRKDPLVPPGQALELAAAARDPKLVLNHAGGHDPFAGPRGASVADGIGDFLLDELVDRTTP